MKRSSLAGLMLVLALLVPIQAVSAASPSLSAEQVAHRVVERVLASSDPDRAYASLSPADRAAFDADQTPVAYGSATIVTPQLFSVAASASTITCGYGRVGEVYATDVFGAKIWSYFQQLDWCGNGTQVTWASGSRWFDNHGGAWTYTPQGLTAVYGPNKSYYQYFGQAQVQWCLALLCQTRYPWQNMKAYPNGGFDWTTGS